MVLPEDTLTGDELYSLRLHARDAHGNRVTQATLADWCAVTSNTIARAERNELDLSASLRRLVVYALAEHGRQPVAKLRDRLIDRRGLLTRNLREQARAASEYRFEQQLGTRRTPKKRKRR